MTSHTEIRVLPYTPEQLFDLVADVESYPEFLPGWLSANICHRISDTLYVEQCIGVGAVRRCFSSQTFLKRPHMVHVTSEDGPFKRLDIRWHFTPAPINACRVALCIDSQFNAALLRHVFETAFGQATTHLVTAFETRAHHLYGPAQLTRSFQP